MLWDNYYKEYHQDMGFDVLWGNDIVSQSSKTPEEIADLIFYVADKNIYLNDSVIKIDGGRKND